MRVEAIICAVWWKNNWKQSPKPAANKNSNSFFFIFHQSRDYQSNRPEEKSEGEEPSRISMPVVSDIHTSRSKENRDSDKDKVEQEISRSGHSPHRPHVKHHLSE